MASESSEEQLADKKHHVHHHMDHRTRIHVLWAGFWVGMAMEVWIAYSYGWGKEDAGDCNDNDGNDDGEYPFQCLVMSGFEVLCSIGFTTVILKTILGFLSSLVQGGCAKSFGVLASKMGHTVREACIPLCVATVFALVGMLHDFVEHKLHPWLVQVCHIFDALCHAIMFSAIIGFLLDFCCSLIRGGFRNFCSGFLLCRDEFEGHGVMGGEVIEELLSEGSDTESSTDVVEYSRKQTFVRGRGMACKMAKVLVILLVWSATAAVATASVFAAYFPERLPEWVPMALTMEGGIYWAGIAWWVSIVGQHRFGHRSEV